MRTSDDSPHNGHFSAPPPPLLLFSVPEFGIVHFRPPADLNALERLQVGRPRGGGHLPQSAICPTKKILFVCLIGNPKTKVHLFLDEVITFGSEYLFELVCIEDERGN